MHLTETSARLLTVKSWNVSTELPLSRVCPVEDGQRKHNMSRDYCTEDDFRVRDSGINTATTQNGSYRTKCGKVSLQLSVHIIVHT